MPLPPFPWLFPYVEDLTPPARYPEGTERSVFRPLVEVSFRGRLEMEHKVAALVDSGSEHTLAAPWVARALGLELNDAHRTMNLRLGGETVGVFFHDIAIRLLPPGGTINEYIEWSSEVGFLDRFRVSAWSAVLGQVGFFDHFTITMQRSALTLSVEGPEKFDERFAALIREAEERRPPTLP